MKRSVLLIALSVAPILGFGQSLNESDSTKSKTHKYKPKISGLIQFHYQAEFNTNGDTIQDPSGFRILRARLTAEGKITDDIRYNIMIDPRAPEQGGVLRDCYIEFDQIKNQKIRIGQQKTQFGWENRESVSELYTVNRAEMSDAVCRGENLRDVGIGIIGHIPLKNNLRIENAMTFTNGTRMNVRGPFDFNTRKALWGRIGLRYKKNDLVVRFGLSGGYGGLRYLSDLVEDPSDDVYVDFYRSGVDVEIDHPNFFLAAEYGIGRDLSADTVFAEPFGYQGILALKFRQKFGPLVKYDVTEDEWKVITVGAYYGLPKDKIRVIVNYVFRGQVTDVPRGHDDRLYVQLQLRF